jgi:hypothetical protein
VWRIAFEEGYSLEEWADLLKSLKILPLRKAIWRFQELAEKEVEEVQSTSSEDEKKYRSVEGIIQIPRHRIAYPSPRSSGRGSQL